MHSPDAFYDVLTIIGQLEAALGGVSRLEVQRSAYLACLLALYDARPVAEWGHRFARTEFGTPYSAEINDAIGALHSASRLIERDGRLLLTRSGRDMGEMLAGLSSLQSRKRYITAACGSTLAVPPATFSESLDNEPTVKRALQRERGGGLLEGSALALLYEQFDAMSTVLERKSDDLLTPSVVWLTYTANQNSEA